MFSWLPYRHINYISSKVSILNRYPDLQDHVWLWQERGWIKELGKQQAAVAFVDDANLYAEGKTFNKAYANLFDMLEKTGDGLEWSYTHNSRFEKSKFALVGFSRRRVRDPSFPGKTMVEPQPDLVFQGARISPTTSHKLLGVIFDQELHWNEQTEHAALKAAKWTLLFHILTKPSTWVRPIFMRRLYQAVVVPKFTYAADVWYSPVVQASGKKATGSVGATKWLTSIHTSQQ